MCGPALPSHGAPTGDIARFAAEAGPGALLTISLPAAPADAPHAEVR